MEPLADAVRCAPKWLKSSIAKFREEGISLLYGLSVNAENAYSFRSSSAHHSFPWRSPYTTSRPVSGGAVPGVVWTVSGSALLAWITCRSRRRI
jgi:DNA-binding Lrp family transcriptional regulator